MEAALRDVAAQFQVHGEWISAEPYGGGHINDTYRVTFNQGGTLVRFILQRINHKVFKNPPALMENIERVTRHLHGKLKGDRTRRALTLIPTLAGETCGRDKEGNYWRMFIFIEQARTYDTVQSPEQAFEAARAFGRFQQLLADLPSPRLNETIPDFHNTPKRFAVLERSIEKDAANRAALAQPEIEFALQRRDIVGALIAANLPERITHNDTKFNNVMLDDTVGEGICVIDLDTVMPGLAPYDFGDQVRTATSPASEDERDLSKVHMQMPLFEALVRGYLAGAGPILTKAEKDLLVLSGKLITFEIGIRFLADYLDGDTYFKVHREGHNLDRTRTQFKLIESIERQEDAMLKFVASL